ncbi:MAG: CotH kinase family protein [Ignavibacteriales bacterium]|nr:CotH kinase family protein [Ignavibacteriales bacterium]
MILNNKFLLTCTLFFYLSFYETQFCVSGDQLVSPDSIFDFTSSNLPIFIINTNGQPIPSDEKIEADLGVIYNGEGVRNFLTDPYNHYNGKIGIEIRGSTSQMFPKKSYAIETRDSLGDDLDFPLLNFPSESDWVLYAPYSDKSLIRDVLAYKLSNLMGHYASRFKFCEVVLNGDYVGIYVLLEKIKRDKNRVDIKKLEPADSTGDALTGGYIVKIDKFDGENNDGWISPFPPFEGAWQRIPYQFHYPKPDSITPAQKMYIQNYISQFEALMFSSDYNHPDSGYYDLIDMASAIDYVLINELAKNVDSYRLSFFMHKDRNSVNDKLFFGPVWDYNISFGNAYYYDGVYSDGWMMDFLSTNQEFLNYDNFQVPFWWKKIFNETVFQNSVNTRWRELQPLIFNSNFINSFIDSLVIHLDESQQRNFERWQILGTYVWPNFFIGQTYEEEINFLKSWIQERLQWLGNNMIGTPTEIHYENYIDKDFTLFQNYPNPFNPQTKIKYTIPTSPQSFPLQGGEAKQGWFTVLKVFDILGNEIATLVNTNLEAGEYEVGFNVKTMQATPLPSGIYFYSLSIASGADNFIQTKKMLLLK